MRVALAVALADARERVRRSSFLATLALAALLGYAIVAEVFVLRLGAYRGVYDAAWVGVLTAIALGVFMSLVGFYLVRGGVQRDDATGVGQVLAATPLRSVTYLTGVYLGSLLVLLAVIAALAVAAGVMLLVHGEDRRLDLVGLLMPFVVLTVPVAALTAGAALFFDCVPWLRQGVGNVAYFVVWLVLMVAFGGAVVGFDAVEVRAALALAAIGASYGGGIALGTGGAELTPFTWPGLDWRALALQRWPYLALAAALVALASLPFDRFDGARVGPRSARRRTLRGLLGRPTSAARDAVTDPGSGAEGSAGHALVSPVTLPTTAAGTRLVGFLALTRAELVLLVKGRPIVWYLVAAGLVLACAGSSSEVVRRTLLPLAWIWPLLVWSELGARERVHRVRELVVATPAPTVRPMLAAWLAGVTLALATGSGALVHAVTDPGIALGFAAGACFFPALALALGSATGSQRPFQVVALVLWYLGALNGVAVFDVTAATGAAAAAGVPQAYLALSGLLVLASIGVRWLSIGSSSRG